MEVGWRDRIEVRWEGIGWDEDMDVRHTYRYSGIKQENKKKRKKK